MDLVFFWQEAQTISLTDHMEQYDTPYRVAFLGILGLMNKKCACAHSFRIYLCLYLYHIWAFSLSDPIMVLREFTSLF